MPENSVPNLVLMAERALERRGEPATLADVMDDLKEMGWKPVSDVIGSAVLGAAMYKAKDVFDPLTSDLWGLLAWQNTATPPEETGEEKPATIDQVDVVATVVEELEQVTGPMTLRALTSRIMDRFDLPSDGLMLKVRDALAHPGSPVVLVGQGYYDLEDRAEVVEEDLWLPAKPTDQYDISEQDRRNAERVLTEGGRPALARDLARQMEKRWYWDAADPLRMHAVLSSDPERFALIDEVHWSSRAWETTAQFLLLGRGTVWKVAALLHENLREHHRGRRANDLVRTLGNDPRWPQGEPVKAQTLLDVLEGQPHVFKAIRRVRKGEPHVLWTLHDAAARLLPVVPGKPRPPTEHPIGPSVPMDVPWPDPTIKSEIVRLGEVTLRYLGRGATVKEIEDFMVNTLKWSPPKHASATITTALARRKDVFKRVRPGRYILHPSRR